MAGPNIQKEQIKRDKHFFYDEVKYRVVTTTSSNLPPKVDEYWTTEWHKNHIINTIVGAVAALILVPAILIAPDIIGAGQVGIVTRFGEVNRVAESGLNFHIPFIEAVTKMETRVQKVEAKTDAATRDLQEVNGAIAVNYTLSNENALRVFKELGKDYANTVITPILHESFKQGITGYTAEQLMANRTDVKTAIQEMLTQRLANYGITVVDANLTDLNFSQEFNAAIEQKAVMQQEAERAKQELEKVRIEAEAKVEQARAEAEAQRLQQETLSELMVRKMMIERWDGELPQVVSDSTILKELGL